MTPEQRRRVEELYDRLAELDPARRDAMLDELCADDPAVRQEVRQLLGNAPAHTMQPDDDLAAGLRAAVAPIAAAAGAAGEPAIGASMGLYRILERLGAGGMGAVYKAEQRRPVKRVVALKIIKAGFDTAEVIARFNAERQAMARMDHPHIAKVLDAGSTEAGRPYFAMEYVAGAPITAFADDNRLTIPQRLLLFIQVCDAVAHAHTKAVIHRDIKPSNVLAYLHDGKATVKVIDFGIAKALTHERLTDQTFNTAQGIAIGTYESMSPEQASGSPDIDTRSDVYSLGVLLYELLCGAAPFERATLASAAQEEIRRLIRDVDPPRPSTRLTSLGDAHARVAAAARQAQVEGLAHTLRRELEWIPLKAMRKERDRRYASALQLADDIRNYLERRPLIAGPESRAYRLRKFVARNRGAVAAVTAIVVVLVAGIISTAVALRDAIRARDAEAEQRAVARAEAEKQTAVNKFFNRLIAAANPRLQTATDKTSGRAVTVLEVLRKGAAEIDAGSLRDQPEVEAALRITIGGAFMDLDESATAETHLRQGLQLNRQLYGDEHPYTIICLRGLAHVLQQQGRLAEAEPFARQAVARSRRALAAQPVELGEAINGLGGIMRDTGNLPEAEQLFREALALPWTSVASDQTSRAKNLNDLAYILQLQGDRAGAEAMFREALEINARLFGEDHVDLALSLNNLGMLLYVQGKHVDAESFLRRAVAIDRKHLGNDHADLATVLRNHALVLRALRRLDEAQQECEEALAIRRRRLGDEHPKVAEALTTLAGVRQDQDDLVDAEAHFRAAYAIRQSTLPSGDPVRAQTAGALGQVLLMQRKYEGAEPLLLAAYDTLGAAGPAYRGPSREAADRLAKLYDAWGKPGEHAKWQARASDLAATAPSVSLPASAPSR
jgi:serine/threonine protein kinase/Flp pilus assembly protein TadD